MKHNVAMVAVETCFSFWKPLTCSAPIFLDLLVKIDQSLWTIQAKTPTMAHCFLLVCLLIVPFSTQELIHVVAPVYMEYKSIGVLINSFQAQSNGNWTLTIVSDGPDDRYSLLSIFLFK
jgi:hypothetical protein